MNAAKTLVHSAVQVCSVSLICPIINEVAKKVCSYCKCIPEAAVGPTKDEYLQVKSALLEVRRKAFAFGYQSTDVKKVYEKSWIRLTTQRSPREAKRCFSSIRPSMRKMSLITNYCLVLFAVFCAQNYIRFESSPCLVFNNYFLMEITRPVTDCSYCTNVNSVIVLDNPSKQQFAELAYSAKPMLVKRATSNWTALSVFSFDYFKQIYSDVKDGYKSIEEECQFFPFRTSFIRLSEVFALPEEIANATHATADPWYVGWSNCNPDIAARLRSHYTRPTFLPDDSESSAIDWIFMGYAGQGSSLHLDYVQRPSWQAQISGSKRWRLMPSPECETQCNAFDVTVNEGDIILIDTNKWYHDTLVNPGKISITIGSEYD